MSSESKRPSCIRCLYHYITYDNDKPYGCRAMGFKSAQNPAAMVFASSRIECQLFQAKPKVATTKTGNGNSDGGVIA